MALYLNGSKISNSLVVNGAVSSKLVNISDFAFNNKVNTTNPTVTKISDYEFALSYQDQTSSGYEQCIFRVTLSAGTYVAQIKASIDKNPPYYNQYTWGIYSSSSYSNASAYPRTDGFSTYVPFVRTDTDEHTYYVPIVVRETGYSYICFTTSDDNGDNATVTVSSLKIFEGDSIIQSESDGNATKVALVGWKAGVYIDNTNGQEVSFSTWSATNFIEISGDTLTVVGVGADSSSNATYNAFYDNNKNFISNFSFADYEITIPSTARYIRLSAKTSYINNNACLYYNSSDDSNMLYERLCYVEYVGYDREEIPAISTIDQGTNYSNYLSYDNTTKKFTVLQDFTGIVTAWVYQYSTSSMTAPEGRFYINDVMQLSYVTDSLQQGTTAGSTIEYDFKQGDTFYNYTPSSHGYPQQMLKVYVVLNKDLDLIGIMSFSDETA